MTVPISQHCPILFKSSLSLQAHSLPHFHSHMPTLLNFSQALFLFRQNLAMKSTTPDLSRPSVLTSVLLSCPNNTPYPSDLSSRSAFTVLKAVDQMSWFLVRAPVRLEVTLLCYPMAFPVCIQEYRK